MWQLRIFLKKGPRNRIKGNSIIGFLVYQSTRHGLTSSKVRISSYVMLSICYLQLEIHFSPCFFKSMHRQPYLKLHILKLTWHSTSLNQKKTTFIRTKNIYIDRFVKIEIKDREERKQTPSNKTKNKFKKTKTNSKQNNKNKQANVSKYI